MTIEAVGHRVIIRPDAVVTEREVKTDSGLVVKLQVQVDKVMEANASVAGVILSIGEDAWTAFKPKREHAGLQVGERVYYAKYAGKWITDPETKEEVLVVQDEDIVAKDVKKGNGPQ